MARIEITFFAAGNRSREGGTMPVPHALDMRTEALEVAANQGATSTLSSTQPDGSGFVRVLADADLWVCAGRAPAAAFPAAGEQRPGFRVKAGAATELAVMAGDRVAVWVAA